MTDESDTGLDETERPRRPWEAVPLTAGGATDPTSPTNSHRPVSLRSVSLRSVSLRSVSLPSEHGGWSLTAEPALLGLLVAWSWPGLALAVAALVAFVARTPLKLVLVDRWRHRWLERTRLAAAVAACEVALFIALILYASTAAEAAFWLPLAVAAPLIVLELWFDMRSRSRRLVPELAGAIGIGSVATAIALADGTSDLTAWGLWLVIAARATAAIPYVRTQILRGHERQATLWHSDVAQVIAVAAATGGAIADWLPAVAAMAVALVAVFNLVAVRLPVRPAVRIGIEQTFVGIAVILATAMAS